MKALPFFEVGSTFDHPFTRWMAIGVAALLAGAALVIAIVPATPALKSELWRRHLSWCVMAPLMLATILLGPGCTVVGVTVVGLACYREFARATALASDRVTYVTGGVGIVAVGVAAGVGWYGLFVALSPLGLAAIAMSSIVLDRPSGYLRRVGLAALGFMLFGCGLGHLGILASVRDYRPMLLMLLVAVQLNDVFGFVVGKTLGHRKLAPHTSPGKTWAGALGALVLTAPLAALMGHLVFRGTPLDRPAWLLLLAVVLAVVGTLGDLTLSSIKRDLGIKDMGQLIPGHGGVLDRCNSLLFTAPAFFHYVAYANRLLARAR